MIIHGSTHFGDGGFPLAILRVHTDSKHMPSHEHDLTEVEHHHDFSELVLVTKGQAMHCLEGHHFPVSTGDVFLLQGKQSHYFYARKDLTLINVLYDAEKLGLPETELRRLPGYCALFLIEPNVRQQHRFASRLHLDHVQLAGAEKIAEKIEAEYLHHPPGWEITARTTLQEMIIFLSRTYTQTNTTVEAGALLRIGHIIGELENNVAHDWKFEELAKMAHMSGSSFLRIFRKATGHSPIKYLLKLRVKRAMTLLRSSDKTVTEIAMEVGFNDSNYFTRQFRIISGTTPSKYRKPI